MEEEKKSGGEGREEDLYRPVRRRVEREQTRSVEESEEGGSRQEAFHRKK